MDAITKIIITTLLEPQGTVSSPMKLLLPRILTQNNLHIFLSTPRVGMKISVPTILPSLLLNKKANLERCVQLLEVASSFWQRNQYNSSHCHKQRHLRGYPENPSDLDALTSALDKASQANLVERNSEDVSHLAAQIVTRRQREQELRLAAERKRELENNANGNRKKQKRFRFRSLM